MLILVAASAVGWSLLGAAGCRRDSASSAGTATGPRSGATAVQASDLGPVVARVGDSPIHAAEVSAQAARSGVPPRQALDQLINFALLAERARQRSGSDPLPGAPPSLLVQRLLERDFERDSRPQDIPEEELRRAYESVKIHYVRPRMVEVGLLSIYTGPGMKPAPRARAQETARLLQQHLTRNPPRTIEEWAAIINVAPWSERKVRYWRFWQGPSREHGPFGGKVAPAVQQLRRPGERSGLIEDDSGYHFAWYLGDQAPRNVPFEQAREEVREKFYPTWRQQRFLRLTRDLGAAYGVQLFPDRLFARPGS